MSWVPGFLTPSQPFRFAPASGYERAETAHHDGEKHANVQDTTKSEDLQSMEEEAGTGAPYWQVRAFDRNTCGDSC